MKNYLFILFLLMASTLFFGQNIEFSNDVVPPLMTCKYNIKIDAISKSVEISTEHLLLDYSDDKTKVDELILSMDRQYPIDSLLHRRHFFYNGRLASSEDYINFNAYRWDPKTRNTFKRYSIDSFEKSYIIVEATVFDQAKNFATCNLRIKIN